MNENEKEGTTMAVKDAGVARMAVPCMICGAFVELNERESRSVEFGHRPVKVCPGCKNAVMFIRQQMTEAGL